MKKERIYDRVSGQGQKEGESTEAQDMHLRDISEKEKVGKVNKTYKDIAKSGYIDEDKISVYLKGTKLITIIDLKKRKDFLDALNEADEYDLLRIFKWSRFARNLLVQETALLYLHKHGVEVKPSDDDSNKLVRRIMGSLNENFSEENLQYVGLIREKRLKEGKFPSRTPYGYIPIRKGKIVTSYKINKEEAYIIRQIFFMKDKIDYKRICLQLGITPKQYYSILKKERMYQGYITYKGKEYKGSYDEIL